MWSKVIENWVTIGRSFASGNPTRIVQSSPMWVPAADFQDAQFLIEVGNVVVSGTHLYMTLETAPSEDESLFLPMHNPTALDLPLLVTPGVAVVTALAHSAYGPPLANWVRWVVDSTDSATWSATFRITISAI